MKVRLIFVAALSAFVLPMSLSAQGIADLVNPDDIMLRKPQPDVAEQKAREEAAAKAAAEKAAAEQKAREEAAAKAAAEKEAAERKARDEAAAAERKAREDAEALARLREQVAAARKAREAAEAKAAADRQAADAAIEQAQKAERAKVAAERKADRLANPDPDERPQPPKKTKLEAPEQGADVTASDVKVIQPLRKPKKELTGRAAVITADRTDYDRKEGVILFDRNVYVDDEQYQMHADRLFVFLDGTNELKRIVALGNVAITNELKTAACGKAVYNRTAQRIVMYAENDTNLAMLCDAGTKKGEESEVKGKKITYWLDSGMATVEGVVVTLPGMKGGASPKDLFNAKPHKNPKADDGAGN